MPFYQHPFIVETLIQVMKECNRIIMDERYPEMVIHTKHDAAGRESKLTRGDLRTNEYIVQELTKLNSMIKHVFGLTLNIISEELPITDRTEAAATWCIDPIDGTNSYCDFIRSNVHFTCNIGLIVEGEPVLGFMSDPQTDTIYYGVKGLGAVRSHNGTCIPIRTNEKDFTRMGLRIITASEGLNKKTKEFIKLHFNSPSRKAMSSSLKIGIIASNEADVYPRFGPTYEWDTCAADAILRCAGGGCYIHQPGLPLTNYSEEHLLKYNKENLYNPEEFLVF